MTAPVADATPASAAPAGHRHRWTGVEFLFADEHPFVRLRCACGVERRYRAFERFWDPAVASAPPAVPHTGAER